MHFNKKSQELLVATVSPCQNGKPDIESFKTFLTWLIDNGIEKVVIQGSTGEGVGMSQEYFEEFVSAAHDVKIKNNIKSFEFFVCIANPNLAQMLKLITICEKYSTFGYMIIPPITTKARDIDVVHMFKTINQHTQKPLIIYNNPARFIYNYTLPVYEQILKQNNIYGIKECSKIGSQIWTDLSQLVNNTYTNCKIFAGDDDAWIKLAETGYVDGCITALGNCFPRTAVGIAKGMNKIDSPDTLSQDAMRSIQDIDNLWRYLCNIFNISASPMHLKYLLSQMQLMSEETFYAFAPLTEQEKTSLQNILKFDL